MSLRTITTLILGVGIAAAVLAFVFVERESPAAARHDVAWYERHEAERQAKLAWCDGHPRDSMRPQAECVEAEAAAEAVSDGGWR